MLRVALTGGIASGKTTVSRLFEQHGVPVIDTDLIARDLVEPGRPALQQIVRHFGPSVLQADGHLDRRRLRTRIFDRPDERQVLEDILHPAIHQAVQTRLEALDAPYAIVVIPLLIESRQDWGQDRVLVVDAPGTLQQERLMQRDRCTREEARKALRSQAGRAQRLAIADDIIVNDGEIDHLRQEVERLHRLYSRLATDRDPSPSPGG